MSTVPGGKYGLTTVQVAIERALHGKCKSAKSLAHEPAVLSVVMDEDRERGRKRDIQSVVRNACDRLVRMGLIERVGWSAQRHGYVLTDEGRLDLGARS